MAAWLRDGDAAAVHLRNGGAYSTPSTFFGGVGPAVESVLCQTIGTTEMVLQSATHDPGEYFLRLFPAVPKDWPNVSFRNLRAEGAFEVSARLQDKKLQYVRIKSLAGNACRVELPRVGAVRAVGSRKFTLQKTTSRYGRPVYEIDLKRGETVLLLCN